MTLTRWDPFRDLWGLQRRINDMLSEAGQPWGAEDAYGAWMPPVDIFERGDDLVIRAEVPGVKREEIEIRVENNTLVLRGQRNPEPEIENGKTYRQERSYGAFNRRFSLPATVDAGRIKASYRDGVLEVILPKSEEAKPRSIDITAA